MNVRGLVVAPILAFAVAGCATLPDGYYYREKDGIRADANPAVLAEFQKARAICDGRASQAALSVGNRAMMVRTNIELVFRGCMAEQGYVIR